VLICEDSRAYAAMLRRMLEHDGDLEVVAVCKTAEDAISALPRLAPDLVTMDIQLSGMDGLTAIADIMSSRPLPILVISAHIGALGGTGRAEVLAAGALDWIAKDDLDLRHPESVAARALRRRIKMLSRAPVIRRPRAPAGYRPTQGRHASVIGVCASIGGPQVLATLLDELPDDYPIPVVVVQHLVAGFSGGLARWLDQTVPLRVMVAGDYERVARGVWIAPDGAHLTVAATGHLRLSDDPASAPHRPSGDVLLQSIASSAGRNGVAVVLSGMGRDGAVGAAAVRDAGGLAIAQDQASSAIYGMPKAAADLGVDFVLPPEAIGRYLLELNQAPLAVGQAPGTTP
jgi:two-component system, chemotaxis family, protein-glutamate methylesterase/glutaminase